MSTFFGSLFEDFFERRKSLIDKFFEQDENATENEVFEVTKGDYKTKVTIGFTKEGIPTSVAYSCVYESPEEDILQLKLQELENEKQKALELEDYAKAAEIRDELRKLKSDQGPEKQLANAKEGQSEDNK